MDKYLWHSVRDELPPDNAPLLILLTEEKWRDNDGKIVDDWTVRDFRFGYYAPKSRTSVWRDDDDDPIYESEDFKVTHWMFAPDMPEEQI